MGTDIHGWVEAHLDYMDEEDDWLAMIYAGIILDRDYNAFRRLFGVRDYEDSGIVPIAPRRGFPVNMSQEVREEAEQVYPEDQRYQDGWIGCHSVTWISWAEIQSVNWSEFYQGYSMLFRMMEILFEHNQIDDLRLVVYFDN